MLWLAPNMMIGSKEDMMATDIHAYLEHQPFPGTTQPVWESLASDVHINRDYSLFAILANVRNNRSLAPVAFARGLPEQVSWRTEMAWKEEGGHDASHLSYEELMHAQEIYSRLAGVRDEVKWAPKFSILGDEWRVYGEEREVPHWVFVPPPSINLANRGDLVIAVRSSEGPFGPHPDLTAILAFLGVYEARGNPTRMIFWFDS